MRLGIGIFLAVMLLGAGVATAQVDDGAQVVAARAVPTGDLWRFEVTVRHDDKGWEDYADKWDVLSPDGTVLGTRVLVHPHVTEQPFTRSLTGVELPDGLDQVVIRAHDNVNGYSGNEFVLELPKSGS